DDNKTILLVTVDPIDWTWKDAHNIVRTQVEMMQTVAHTVHTIFAFTTSPRMPNRDEKLFTHLRSLLNTRADNEGLSIFVGTNKLFSTLLNTVGKVNRLTWLIEKYHFVTTFDQACDIIAQHKSNVLETR
ncbi:MAG: hypothetical protein AAFQ52_07190, partial [Chloroflexota bacterium]